MKERSSKQSEYHAQKICCMAADASLALVSLLISQHIVLPIEQQRLPGICQADDGWGNLRRNRNLGSTFKES